MARDLAKPYKTGDGTSIPAIYGRFSQDEIAIISELVAFCMDEDIQTFRQWSPNGPLTTEDPAKVIDKLERKLAIYVNAMLDIEERELEKETA
jgi:hypothetical protein